MCVRKAEQQQKIFYRKTEANKAIISLKHLHSTAKFAEREKKN